MTPTLKRRIAELDAELIAIAKPILVLKYLNWSDDIEDTFLQGWRSGRPRLPALTLTIPDWSAPIAALDDFV